MKGPIDRSYPGLARFEPRLDILPPAQRAVWARFGSLPADAVLYGGTGLALRLGHRTSVDFDFFLARSFAPGEMRREIAAIGPLEVVQSAADTLGVRVDGVQLSLFGVDLATVASPEVTTDVPVPVASLLDIGATKAQTIIDRAEAKDYLDLDALVRGGLRLADLLGAAQIVFGPRFSPMLALKALASYEDGDLPSLPEPIRRRLSAAAAEVSGIPIMGAHGLTVSPFVRHGGTIE
ncbi:MAG: nucleotidyl transferase AbiEii/AbiGii toxin family protein [Candidatus Limnocylindrales bacterium]